MVLTAEPDSTSATLTASSHRGDPTSVVRARGSAVPAMITHMALQTHLHARRAFT